MRYVYGFLVIDLLIITIWGSFDIHNRLPDVMAFQMAVILARIGMAMEARRK